MSNVAGRIIVHETGNGIPDLTLVLLDVDQSAYPVFASGDLVSNPSSVMHDLRVRRLGTAISVAQGHFSIDYTFKAEDRARPNLALLILTPEMAGGDECQKVLYVSCDIRTAASENENYLVVLPKALLYQAGLTEFGVRGSATLPVETPDHLKEVRDAWRDDSEAPKLSEVYRKKLKVLEETRAKNGIPERGFRLSLPLISSGNAGQSRVAFDDKAKKWFMHKGEEKAEIRFVGVVSASDLKVEERPPAGVGVMLDEDRKEFRLVVASPVFSLRAAEDGPGELFIWNLKQQYRRAHAQREPVDAMPPDDNVE
jgi:hypothetical protein